MFAHIKTKLLSRTMAASLEAKKKLDEDEDIKREAEDLFASSSSSSSVYQSNEEISSENTARLTVEENPFTLMPGTGGHRSSAVTQRLLREAGGAKALRKFFERFYQYTFKDKHLDKFIRDRTDPHSTRFANWVAEKFGDPKKPWTRERRNRAVCPFSSHGHRFETPHDRSSAHYAAWHSPKRSTSEFGRRFKLDDCRVWMRLHFLALRESGICERSPAFTAYYVKFIGHFVSVYERTAPAFARAAFRWSANPSNLRDYMDQGRLMDDIIGISYTDALDQIPKEEAHDRAWPYPALRR